MTAATVSASPTNRNLGLIVLATSLSFVVIQLDVTIVNLALLRIGVDLSIGVAGLQWVVDAYTLAYAMLMLSAGTLGDRFGARRGFVAGLLIFALASLACGLAPNGYLLIAARALQGIGAAAMLPNSLALLNHACAHDPRRRARAIGWWTAAGAISIAAGPVAGGVLLETLGWRSIFLVNLPLCAIGVLLVLRYLPETMRHPERHDLDVKGQMLATLALGGLISAIIELPVLGGNHPVVISGFALAATAGALFVTIESRVAHPMLPLGLFRQRAFSAAVLFGMFVNLTYYGVIFVLSLYLQRSRGYTALQAGLAFLPLTGGFFFSNVLSGWMVGKLGSRPPMILGGLVAAFGYALLCWAAPQTSRSYLALLPAFLIIPGGMGLAVPAMTTSVLSNVDKARSGTASAILNTARQAAGSIGVAVFGALTGSGEAQHIVTGLEIAAAVSCCVLLLAVATACAIRRPSQLAAAA